MVFDNKKYTIILIATTIIVVQVSAITYQMYESNKRMMEDKNSIDIPNYEEDLGEWIRYDGSQTCPGLVKQQFDTDQSHYRCMYHK